MHAQPDHAKMLLPEYGLRVVKCPVCRAPDKPTYDQLEAALRGLIARTTGPVAPVANPVADAVANSIADAVANRIANPAVVIQWTREERVSHMRLALSAINLQHMTVAQIQAVETVSPDFREVASGRFRAGNAAMRAQTLLDRMAAGGETPENSLSARVVLGIMGVLSERSGEPVRNPNLAEVLALPPSPLWINVRGQDVPYRTASGNIAARRCMNRHCATARTTRRCMCLAFCCAECRACDSQWCLDINRRV